MDIINRLTRISLFARFREDEAVLKQIAAIISAEKFKAGAYILREGEEGDKMYILNKGEVRVEKKTLAGDPFTVMNLRDDMNVFFGEVALMDNDLRSASIRALTETECYVLRKTDFEKFCEENTRAGYYIIRAIAKSLAMRMRKVTSDNINLIDALVADENLA